MTFTRSLDSWLYWKFGKRGQLSVKATFSSTAQWRPQLQNCHSWAGPPSAAPPTLMLFLVPHNSCPLGFPCFKSSPFLMHHNLAFLLLKVSLDSTLEPILSHLSGHPSTHFLNEAISPQEELQCHVLGWLIVTNCSCIYWLMENWGKGIAIHIRKPYVFLP